MEKDEINPMIWDFAIELLLLRLSPSNFNSWRPKPCSIDVSRRFACIASLPIHHYPITHMVLSLSPRRPVVLFSVCAYGWMDEWLGWSGLWRLRKSQHCLLLVFETQDVSRIGVFTKDRPPDPISGDCCDPIYTTRPDIFECGLF